MKAIPVEETMFSYSKQQNLWQKIWKNKKAYAFLIPIFILLSSLKYIPFVTAIWKSFFEWNGANIDRFIGLRNYADLMKDPLFYISLKNFGIMGIATIVANITFPLLAALLVFHLVNKRLKESFKVLFVFPMVVPAIVVFLMWQWIYAGDLGVINQLLKAIGLQSWTHAWLGESKTALWAVIFVNFPWISGVSFLLWLGGLMAISEELFEVTCLEGMGPIRRFWHIEFPLIRGQLKLILVLIILQNLQHFENILVLTNGGPGSSTTVPAFYLYNQAFSYNNMGYASAIGVVLFVIVLLLTFLNYKFVKSADKE